MEKPKTGSSVGKWLNLPALEDLRVEEELEQFRIELTIFYGELQDVERALQVHGLLVRAVAGRKCVKNIGDGHHARLHRNLRRAQLVGITSSVQLLVVSARDVGDGADLSGPRNLLQEVERVHHVRLNLQSLGIIERALADGKEPHFVQLPAADS